MSISIIIPAYNSERYLPAAVESVLAQTVRDWELLIIDDGSQDSSPKIASAYAAQDHRIKLVEQPNAGVAEARNTGFVRAARNMRYVTFLDADDVFEPEALGELKSALEDHPNVVAAHGTAKYIGPNGEPVMSPLLTRQIAERRVVVGEEITPRPSAPFTTFETLIVANCIITPGACLIRRSEIDAVGLFDKAMSSCEDWDLWIRLSRRGPMAYVDHPVVAYRRHSENISNNTERHRLASDRVRNKATFSSENNAQQARIARFVYGLFAAEEYRDRLQWAMEALQEGNVLSAAKQIRHATMARARSRHVDS